MICRIITTQRYLIDVCDVELWSFKLETIFQFLVPMLQSFPHDSWVAINELKVKILWWFSWWQEIHRFEISFPWVQFRPYLNHPGSSIQKYLNIQHHVIFNIFQDEWWFEQYSWALFKVRSLLWVMERWDFFIWIPRHPCVIGQGTPIDCVNWMVLKNKIWRRCHTCCASVMDDSRPRIWLISGSLSSGANHHHHRYQGLPVYSHHDKIPPWWGNVNNDKGGNVSVTKSHHTWNCYED